MDMSIIHDTISNLESAETNMRNVKDLALLYIVRDKIMESANDESEKELNDILPYYQKYVTIKRAYQTGIGSIENVDKAIADVCDEIFEFIDTLYRSTDTESEQLRIKGLITRLQRVKY